MQIKPIIGSVVGESDNNHWGQVLITQTAYGVVEIETTDGIARTIGIGLLGKLSDRLSESVVSLDELKKVVSEFSNSSVVSLILLVPVGMVVYVVVGGAGAIYLKRGDQLACLIDKAGALSGQIQEGDTILAVTRNFVGALSQEEILSVFDNLPAGEVAEKLTLLLHEENGGLGGAGLIFQAGQAVPIEEVVAQPTVKTEKWLFLHRKLQQAKSKLDFLEAVNKKALLIASLSILLFFTSVFLGIAKRTGTASAESVKTALTQAQYAFDEGVALLDLNPVKGRQRISQAKMILEPLSATISGKTKEGRQLRTLLSQITDRLTLSMQIVKGEPQLFYDVALLKKDSLVTSMALFNDQIALLDAAGKTVYVVGLATKNGQVVAGGDDFSDAKFVSIHGDKIYILVPDGVHMIRISDKKTEPLVIKKDDEWGIISSAFSFGGNVYLLDTAKSRIWKYVSAEKGFSERREYLNPDTLPDLSKTTGMTIDGSVWMGTSDGKILRFTQGKENTFITNGISPALGNSLIVYVSDQTKNVYVLDSQNKRVVITDSEGNYLSQYVWEGNFVASQFVVNESLKKILFLSDGKIYALDLK